ncbi:hypothetical protein THRCLA_07283 [Thraustotheca clavata]|uniref:Apoptosis antagonizing transcription factor n=1 Tax=Thraustotheca clavata TaxID=74557 RepID=A0A1V9ZEW3_9STRA|nr:hypothetical protein THRCLA_07283 [Thraustotheca clavata]
MSKRLKGLAQTKHIFSVDDDEYDDGTAAVAYSGSEASDTEEPAARASSLRVQNSQFDDTDPAYEGKVVHRNDLKDEDELEAEMQGEWSEGEPFAVSDDSEHESEQEEEEIDENEQSQDENDEDVDDVIRALEKEDSAVFMRAKDIETQQHKAKHVYHQKLIWERCLELQICIKRLITTINNLSTTGSDEENSKRTALAAQLRSCMATMHSMQQDMYTLPEFTPDEERSFDVNDIWTACSEEATYSLPLYQSILNKYARQADGAAQKKFKAVNQDVLVQVDAVLADPQRIRRKAHPVNEEGSTDSESLDETQYDDREFYQQLLKEYIESGATESGLAAGLKLKRKRKNVNRKASKGRVIKYTVMPKLQHFMFPDPSVMYKTNMDIDELFRSLFSSTVSAI